MSLIMQQDSEKTGNSVASQISNLQSSNLTESLSIDPPHYYRTLPPLPFHLKDSKSALIDNPIAHSMILPTTRDKSIYTHLSPESIHTTAETPRLGANESLKVVDYEKRGGLSFDNADVRLAAEALGDLRAGSPLQQNSNALKSTQSFFNNGNTQREPLLSLLTTSHPLIGSAIGGSLSAYSASKKYSPRFKSGAEYVERRFTPVVNTVGSVGRIAGVEGGVRWILGGKNSVQSHSETKECVEISNKRRRLDENNDADDNLRKDTTSFEWRRRSQNSATESLPAYDELRSPSFELNQELAISKPKDDTGISRVSWHSRLALSTSGLSIAMSDESLRSLKYCLSRLRWANKHIGKAITALKNALDQYDNGCHIDETAEEEMREPSSQSKTECRSLGSKITELMKDVLKTLRDVVDTISKYAGGALPENARILVRRLLTSLPQRFCIASSRPKESIKKPDNAKSRLVEGGRRVLVLAKEGLDMMSQVSGVLNGAIISAEDWCERLGRSSREGRDNENKNLGINEKQLYDIQKLEPTSKV